MSKSTSPFQKALLTRVQMFTPKMRGYAVHLLGLQEKYNSLYGQERLWTSFLNGIDRQALGALKELHDTQPDIVSFIVDKLDWSQYMKTKGNTSVSPPTTSFSAQTVYQNIIDFEPAIVSYLVDRLQLNPEFHVFYPGYIHNRETTVGIDEKLLQQVEKLQDKTPTEQKIKTLLLEKISRK